jgi:outer membrane protein assembly factor BamB
MYLYRNRLGGIVKPFPRALSSLSVAVLFALTILSVPSSASLAVGHVTAMDPITVGLTTPSITTPSPTAWSQFRFNDSHDGLSPLHGPTTGTLAWVRYAPSGRTVAASPVQAANGTILVSNWKGLASFDANGTAAGTIVAGQPFGGTGMGHYVTITATPAINSYQTEVVGLSDGYLLGLNSNPALAWHSTLLRTNSPGNKIESITVTPTDRVYATTSSGRLFALTGDGHTLWNFSTHGVVDSAPTVAPDGTIYVGSSNGVLYAIAPNGTEDWSYTTSAAISTSVAMGSAGLLLFGSQNGNFYALDSNGSMAWKFHTGNSIQSSAGVAADGSIYFGSSDGHLYALYPNGTERWAFSTGSPVLSSPAVDVGGVVYFGDDAGGLYALNSGGSVVWNTSVGGEVQSSPIIGLGGTLYVMDTKANLYAFQSSALGGVHFHESGLPNGTAWSVQLGSTTTASGTPQINFDVPLGEHQAYVVPSVACGPGCRFEPSVTAGTIHPKSQGVNVTVVFEKQYQITVVLVAAGASTIYSHTWEVADAKFMTAAPADSPYGFVNWTTSTPLLTINNTSSAVIVVYAGAPGVLRAHYT